jgi:beta-phosphoglucomutase family hydrolase
MLPLDLAGLRRGPAGKIGAIFDWDGVIIDSSALHEKSWERLAAETGFALPPDHFKRGFGMKNSFIIPKILKWTEAPEEVHRLSLRKEELYRKLVVEHGIGPLPGVDALLDELKRHGIPCASGSSTERLNIDTILNVLGIGKYFSAIVSAEDVSHGKPDPEVFLSAARRIERDPAHCVVFEDALVGIEAAHRGGMKVVGVATTNPIEAIAGADLAIHRLDELSVDKLIALFQQGH